MTNIAWVRIIYDRDWSTVIDLNSRESQTCDSDLYTLNGFCSLGSNIDDCEWHRLMAAIAGEAGFVIVTSIH